LISEDHKKVKLIDLGIARSLEKANNTKSANQGTPRYMSPEAINGNFSDKNDIWSFACILLQLTTGMIPYYSINNEQIIL